MLFEQAGGQNGKKRHEDGSATWLFVGSRVAR